VALVKEALGVSELPTDLLCAPVAPRGKTLGALIVYSRRGQAGDRFGRADLELLQAFANAAAVAVENARLHAELKGSAAELEHKVEERTWELEEAHARLVHSERFAAIGQLASVVSHELRNPLAAMNNSVYYLKMKLDDVLRAPKGDGAAKVKRHLDILEREITTSDGIISEILDYTRPKPPALKECDLNSMVEEALERATGLDKLEVVRELAPGLPPVKADPDRMQQVFLNIVKNAAEAMPQGGRLTITTARRDSYLEVSFQDNGPGIPPENLQLIFGPLFTTKARGTGLGLSISKAIVEAHHGSIEVMSQPGKGATFAIRLPLG